MTPQQEQFINATRWLRPVTRWAAAFSVNTAGWLPAAVRNLPLKLVKRLLQKYHRDMNSGCKSS